MNAVIVIIAAIVIYFLLTSSTSSSTIQPINNASIGTDISNAFNSISSATNSLVQDIQNAATANNLNPAILYGIVSAEQNSTNPTEWNANAYNPNDPSGAYGLTQVLASTAQSFNASPEIIQSSPTAALSVTAQYINRYSPDANSMSQTAATYNGGPGIFAEIANGTVPSKVINSYVNKAIAGYNYYNAMYGSSN